jgi:hypothetical protein
MLIGTINATEGKVELHRPAGWKGVEPLASLCELNFSIETISVSDGLWGLGLLHEAAEDLGEPYTINPAAEVQPPERPGQVY